MADNPNRVVLDPVEPPSDLPLRASEDIQGNILAGFSKDHQTFLLLQFRDMANGRAYLGELTPRIATTKQVTTFNAQFSNARTLNGGDDPEKLKAVWVNVGLTSHGILVLAPGARNSLNQLPAFQEGPAARSGVLSDIGLSSPDRWLFGRANQPPVDLILTIAADEDEDLKLEVDRQRALAVKHGLVIVFEQRGDTLPNERAGHEHFGFKDGVSQPGVKNFHPVNPDKPTERAGHPGTEMINPGEFVVGLENESGSTPNVPGWMHNGSFQVFRRLSQDVAGWWAQVTRNQQSLPSDDPMQADLLASKLVGRWRSGTPLAEAPDRDNRSERNPERDNDFKFEDDPDGIKTPHFAHIRKMYPRDHAQFGDRTRRIMRRGIPFGATFDPTFGRGHGVDADRGLIFNVFMASIEDQFEFLQQTWANNPGFPGGDDGPDPVIGEASAPVKIQREGKPDLRLDFRRFVHTSGGIYAFAPSLTALRQLAEGAIGGGGEEPPPFDLNNRVKAGTAAWRLRAQPGLSGKVVVMLAAGTAVRHLDDPRSTFPPFENGRFWFRVRVGTGASAKEGWIAGDGLEKQPPLPNAE
jgi:Dyp-type peroxidase family